MHTLLKALNSIHLGPANNGGATGVGIFLSFFLIKAPFSIGFIATGAIIRETDETLPYNNNNNSQ